MHWQRKRMPATLAATDHVGPDFNLLSGDDNWDNSVNIDDFLSVASTCEQSYAPRYRADLTDNRVVEVEDFMVLGAVHETDGD